MECQQCNERYDDSFAFCPHCGRREVPHPAQDFAAQSIVDKPKPVRSPPGEHVVLVVDDDESIVKSLSLHLRMYGYKVLAALDGEQAVMIAHRKKPDVILLDIAMPGLNGFWVIEKLKDSAYTRKIPIIIISAFTQEDKIAKARELGAAEYITKPYEARKITELVEKYLAK